jgi:hypothetical protein
MSSMKKSSMKDGDGTKKITENRRGQRLVMWTLQPGGTKSAARTGDTANKQVNSSHVLNI